MSIQNNYPILKPTLNLNFLKRKRLDPRINFTRTSTATYTSANGTLMTAAANTARFDYDPITLTNKGLLIESSRVNYMLQSQSFATYSPWFGGNTTGNVVFTSNAKTAPDGTNTATLMTTDSTSAQHCVYQSFSIAANTPLVLSFYFKQSVNCNVGVIMYASNAANNFSATFNTSNGQVMAYSSNPWIRSYGSQNVGNGWYRCYVSGNTIGDGGGQHTIYLANSTGAGSFVGDGISNVYIWGAQVETTSASGLYDPPTSYIYTTSSTVTRSADVASLSTNTSWFNQNQGTLYAEGSSFGSNESSTRRLWQLDDGTTNNEILLGFNISANTDRFLIQNNASFSADFNISANANSVNRMAGVYNYQTGNAIAAFNSTLTTKGNGTIPIVNILRIGTDTTTGSASLMGWLRKVEYYPFELSNTSIQSLTQSP
jgi:hypothetical protein